MEFRRCQHSLRQVDVTQKQDLVLVQCVPIIYLRRNSIETTDRNEHMVMDQFYLPPPHLLATRHANCNCSALHANRTNHMLTPSSHKTISTLPH
eukprot:scaffold3608_cov114-Skeletonema_dohrnii-CCMP3373.AAC.1